MIVVVLLGAFVQMVIGGIDARIYSIFRSFTINTGLLKGMFGIVFEMVLFLLIIIPLIIEIAGLKIIMKRLSYKIDKFRGTLIGILWLMVYILILWINIS
ncbi:Uncharacterised protein [Candidatus Bilamarchaeum dharawalense]|uniref:Uncharacterized protein n=1 Tax=Candidatus Bilamarchaeum dharawalense TaxID=2885759 RepID=A0A5E4LRP3_9ARCH|nr:Uncharacterised protein [Candidatus Bilamarchaeum dharawalense]